MVERYDYVPVYSRQHDRRRRRKHSCDWPVFVRLVSNKSLAIFGVVDLRQGKA